MICKSSCSTSVILFALLVEKTWSFFSPCSRNFHVVNLSVNSWKSRLRLGDMALILVRKRVLEIKGDMTDKFRISWNVQKKHVFSLCQFPPNDIFPKLFGRMVTWAFIRRYLNTCEVISIWDFRFVNRLIGVGTFLTSSLNNLLKFRTCVYPWFPYSKFLLRM